ARGGLRRNCGARPQPGHREPGSDRSRRRTRPRAPEHARAASQDVVAAVSLTLIRRTVESPLRIALVAVGLAGLLVAASLASARPGPMHRSDALVGVVESRALFAGIPQHGLALGSASAPLTIEEFADLQCPFCMRWSLDQLPRVVDPYVRRGQVRLVFRPL